MIKLCQLEMSSFLFLRKEDILRRGTVEMEDGMNEKMVSLFLLYKMNGS